ncbi:hypothetical protein EVAR_97291_1 [Eumeta japonica]|uniref:Uncharacterized protein n=1 Tax=Eumeta variegata TaxID=151549 RepID=A0A4C1XHS4_EUMVA|nr:hypothetical protein EVAR_97291_1 [Eumeta japonica]
MRDAQIMLIIGTVNFRATDITVHVSFFNDRCAGTPVIDCRFRDCKKSPTPAADDCGGRQRSRCNYSTRYGVREPSGLEPGVIRSFRSLVRNRQRRGARASASLPGTRAASSVSVGRGSERPPAGRRLHPVRVRVSLVGSSGERRTRPAPAHGSRSRMTPRIIHAAASRAAAARTGTPPRPSYGFSERYENAYSETGAMRNRHAQSVRLGPARKRTTI